jgi:hypothetical protein
MSRRKVRNWSADEKVADATVAPYRYGDDFDTEYRWMPTNREKYPNFADLKAAVPYQPGDVVWVEGFDNGGPNKAAQPKPKKGRIVDFFFEYTRYGDRLECYVVQFETKQGLWAKVGTKTWPGYIERGYKQANAI